MEMVHFLIDEMVADIFVSSYSKKLRQSFQRELSQSTVAIVLQSIRRKRKINNKWNGYQSSSEELDLESTGMQLFRLSKTMRMSSCLHELKSILEEEIAKETFKFPLSFKNKESFGKFLSVQLASLL